MICSAAPRIDDRIGAVTSDLRPKIPTQGWRQILTARKEMLDAFDKARDQARSHEVETYHGRVAEGRMAEMAGWISAEAVRRRLWVGRSCGLKTIQTVRPKADHERSRCHCRTSVYIRHTVSLMPISSSEVSGSIPRFTDRFFVYELLERARLT